MAATAPMDRFYEECIGILERVRTEERDSLNRAADLIAEKLQKGELVHVFGTGGHSVMGAMELFWRAGLRHGTLCSRRGSQTWKATRTPRGWSASRSTSLTTTASGRETCWC